MHTSSSVIGCCILKLYVNQAILNRFDSFKNIYSTKLFMVLGRSIHPQHRQPQRDVRATLGKDAPLLSADSAGSPLGYLAKSGAVPCGASGGGFCRSWEACGEAEMSFCEQRIQLLLTVLRFL